MSYHHQPSSAQRCRRHIAPARPASTLALPQSVTAFRIPGVTDNPAWFGDEMELLINAPNTWSANEDVAGNGASWQMVCNFSKSRRGGIGVGGLLEGEPRSSESA